MWLAISSLPRTSYAGSVYEASSAKLFSPLGEKTGTGGSGGVRRWSAFSCRPPFWSGGLGQDAVFADSFDVTDQCEKTFKENVNVNPVHP